MTESVMRRTRQLVVEALYEAEVSDHAAEAAFERRLREESTEDERLPRSSAGRDGLKALRGVRERLDEIDGYIGDAAPQFPIPTLAVVDRNILRLAIWELLADRSAPVGAVVNEAVELAHRYGGGSSPGFVNGVLRTVSQRIERERDNPRPGPAEPSASNQE